MKKIIQTILSLLHLKKEKGQSIIILTFAFVGLIAFMGLGLDLGLVYIERTNLKRAIDVAVLSGVTELTNEEEAARRAIDYLGLNGYDMTETNIYVRGCLQDKSNVYDGGAPFVTYKGIGNGDGNTNKIVNANIFYPYQITGWGDDGLPDDEKARNVFLIDTYRHQETHGAGACQNSLPKILGESNRLEITGTARVHMNFFSLLGFQDIPVSDHSIAQNVDKLDLAIVLDKSGSMQFNPVCYGCWERKDDPPNPADTPRYDTYTTYPSNGEIYPLGWTADENEDRLFEHQNRIKVCTTPSSNPEYEETVFVDGSYKNIIIEAEMYRINTSPPDPQTMVAGRGYWAFQRAEGKYSSGLYDSTGTSIDDKPAHMSHHPSIVDYDGTTYGKHYSEDEALTKKSAPALWYDFQFYDHSSMSSRWTVGSYANIWVKVHAGRGLHFYNGSYKDPNPGRAYWSLEGLNTAETGAINVSSSQDNSDGDYWHWYRLTPDGFRITSLDTPYTFKFYAGSAGFSIDRIVITSNDQSSGHNSNGSTLGPARYADATLGSASGVACEICNPLYAKTVDATSDCPLLNTPSNPIQPTVNSLNIIFDDWQMPMRSTKEAIKFLSTRMNPESDQLGLVTYNSGGTTKTELTCKRASQVQSGIECVTGSNPYSYTEILKAAEDVYPENSTPTAQGIREGLEVLGFPISPPFTYDTACDGSIHSSCSRGGSSQKVLILITDGEPNSTSYNKGCTSSNAPAWIPDNAAHRCPLYYAKRAAEAGITVYAIGLGYGVEENYIKEIARQGKGLAFFSSSGGDLNFIFNEILSNVYVRLIQ